VAALTPGHGGAGNSRLGVKEMADIPALEWREFGKRLTQIADDLAELKSSVKVSGTKLEALQEFQKKAEKPLSMINLVGSILVLFGLAALGLAFTGAWRLASLEATAATKEQTAKLEVALDHHGKDIGRLEAAIRARDAIRPPVIMETACHDRMGKIGRVTKDSITLVEELHPGKAELTYPVAAGARVLVKGKTATIGDLRPGMFVRMSVGENGEIELIETIEPPRVPDFLKTPEKVPAPMQRRGEATAYPQ
jgi:hypothetical protein